MSALRAAVMSRTHASAARRRDFVRVTPLMERRSAAEILMCVAAPRTQCRRLRAMTRRQRVRDRKRCRLL